MALAKLDCDAVWLSLTKLAAQDGAQPVYSPRTDSITSSSQLSDTNQPHNSTARPAVTFPSFRQLCPAQQEAGTVAPAKGLPGQVQQAHKLLKLVEGVQPAWHAGLSLGCL